MGSRSRRLLNQTSRGLQRHKKNGLHGKSSLTFSAPSTRRRTPRLGVELERLLLLRLPPSLCPHVTHLKLTRHSSPTRWAGLTLTGTGQALQLGQATNKPSGPVIAPSFSASLRRNSSPKRRFLTVGVRFRARRPNARRVPIARLRRGTPAKHPLVNPAILNPRCPVHIDGIRGARLVAGD
jgi:hypothetical protein